MAAQHQQLQRPLLDAILADDDDLAYSLIFYDHVDIDSLAFYAAMARIPTLSYSVLELMLAEHPPLSIVALSWMEAFLHRACADVAAGRSTDGAVDVGARLWRLYPDDDRTTLTAMTNLAFPVSASCHRAVFHQVIARATEMDALQEAQRLARERLRQTQTQPTPTVTVVPHIETLMQLARSRDGDGLMNTIAGLEDSVFVSMLPQFVALVKSSEDEATRSFVDDVLAKIEATMKECRNPIEPSTQESVALVDDLVHIHWDDEGGSKAGCYSRAALLAQIANAADIRFYKRDLNVARADDEGRGYVPSTERVVRLGESYWVATPSLRVLRDDASVTEFRSRVIARNQRIGNAAGNRGISDLHGQAPGESIHWLEPPALFADATSPPSSPRRRRNPLRRSGRDSPPPTQSARRRL